MRRAALALALLAAATIALAAGWPPADAAAAGATGTSAPAKRSALVLFLAAPSPGAAQGPARHGAPDDALEAELASEPALSIGIVSSTEGRYSSAQFLLDATQGARAASSAYPTPQPPALRIAPQGSGAAVTGWAAARARAREAPQLLEPGLLAGAIPGGGAYAGVNGLGDLDALLAADRGGHIDGFSLGSAATLHARVGALLAGHRLVVADLPAGATGGRELRALSAARAPGELELVIERTPDAPGHELLWAAAAGLAGGGGRELTSQTTDERGLVAAIDLAPTILDHLRLTPVPADVRGAPIHTDGALHSGSLRALLARLRVIGQRRLRALGFLLGACALLLICCAPWPRARARALRWTGLGLLWTPVAVLIGAWLEPSAAVEFATLTAACLGLGALTDALVPWPRAPLAPAVAAVGLLVADALAGTQLFVRSLLGPDPILGARFYGIGNELKSGLAVLVLGAVAAALYPVPGDPAARPDPRRAPLAMALSGVALAIVEGSARLGAGVGGVILVCAGFAVATVMLLPGAINRRRMLIVLAAPVVGLVALALLDLATAHGSGHYTGSILHARSAGDLRDVIVRRYGAAWDELHNHAMPVATVLALLTAGYGLCRPERVLAPVGDDAGWRAAFAGGLVAGVIGALVEDSGPVLLVVAVFALGCLLSYLWGRPLPSSSRAPARSPGTTRAARSRARTLSAGPAR